MVNRRGAQVDPPFQVAFIVGDIDAAILHWTEVIGAGPFFTFDLNEWEELYYNGEPVQVEVRVAIGQWGAIQLEFVSQTNDAPSPYKTFTGTGRMGMHHFGSMVEDLDAAVARLEAAGKKRVYWGTAKGGVRFAYLVEDEHPGSMIELIEHGPTIDQMMKIVADAARDWNGSDPVRQFE